MSITPGTDNALDPTPLTNVAMQNALNLLWDWFMYDPLDPDGAESPFDQTSAFFKDYHFTRTWKRR